MIIINGERHNSVSLAGNKELYDGVLRLAQAAEKAGALPPGVDNAWGYVLLVLGGADLGIAPTRATSTLNLLGGRISMSAQAMLGLAYRDAGVRMQVNVSTDERCEATFTREGHEARTVDFTIEEARKAGLIKDKSGWAKYPKDMLLARTITRGLRYVAADVVTGLYSIEELNDGEVPAELSQEVRDLFAAQNADLTRVAAEAITAAPSVPAGTAAKSRREDHAAEVAQAAKVEPKKAEAPAVEAPTHASATQVVEAAGGGKVTQAKLDLSQGQHIRLVTQGNLPNITETTKAIFDAFKEVYPEAMAKGVLREKVKSYGAASSAKLSPLDFMDLYRWADEQVGKAKAQQAQEMIETAEAQADEVADANPIPAFDPHRGAATSGNGTVADAAPSAESLDDQILAIWNDLAAKDAEEPANAIFEKYNYAAHDEGISNQIRRLVLQELQALAQQAA